MISGCYHEVYKKCALLGYYLDTCGNSLLTFRDNLLVPSWRVKNPSYVLTLKIAILNMVNYISYIKLYRRNNVWRCVQITKLFVIIISPIEWMNIYICVYIYIYIHINRLPLSSRCKQTRNVYSFNYSHAGSLSFAHNWLKPIDLRLFYVFRATCKHRRWRNAIDWTQTVHDDITLTLWCCYERPTEWDDSAAVDNRLHLFGMLLSQE